MKQNKLLYYPILPKEGSLGSKRSDYVRKWLDEVLYKKNIATLDENEANAYLVATGDGGMIEAARNKYAKGKVLVGINCGTLGFLMNKIEYVEEIPLFYEDLKLVHLNLLEGTFVCRDGKICTHLAFNDIFCGGNIADYISFDIRGSLSHFQNRRVKGNGIFIASPQGTTAFALNAQGSSALLPLDTKAWYLGGVATGPYPNGVVYPQEITIDINSRRSVNAYADGYTKEVKDVVKIIIRPTSYKVSLGFLDNVDFESRRLHLAQTLERGEFL